MGLLFPHEADAPRRRQKAGKQCQAHKDGARGGPEVGGNFH